MWTFTMFVLFLVVVIALNFNYFNYPTSSGVSVSSREFLNFPSVTVCNLSPYNYSKIKNNTAFMKYITHRSNAKYLMNTSFDWNDPNYAFLHEPGTTDWLKTTSFDLNKFFTFCAFSGDVRPCEEDIEEKVTDSGLCFTFNGPANEAIKTANLGSSSGFSAFIFVNQDNYVFSEYFAAGIKVAIHLKEEEPNMREEGFLVSPGTLTDVAISYNKNRFLPEPYQAFEDGFCVDVEDGNFRNPLLYHKTYSFNACIRECKMKYTYEQCGCRTHTDVGDLEICSFAVEYRCAMNTQKRFHESRELLLKCDCPRPCEESYYTKEISSARLPSDIYGDLLKQNDLTDISKNYIQLRVFFKTLLRQTNRQKAKMTIYSVLADLGGYMGIFLGASILTWTELLQTILITIYLACKREIQRYINTNVPYKRQNKSTDDIYVVMADISKQNTQSNGS